MTADADSTGPAGAQYVITLIHGTWAKNALWAGENSALSKALRERFGERARILRFDWSGSNSHTARREASEELRKELVPRLQEHGGARHYLICHSHGGSVALRAVADSGLQEKIAGVVCMATPFLVARRRDLGRNPWKHLAGALVLVALLIVWIVYGLLLPVSWPDWARLAITVVIGTGVMSAFALLAMKWREYAEKLWRDLASPAVERDKLLIVRSPADEASAALALFQFVSQISVRLLVASQSLYERVEAVAIRLAKQKGKMGAVAVVAFVAFVAVVLVVAAEAPTRSWQVGESSWAGITAVIVIILPLLVAMQAILLVLGRVEETTVLFRLAASAVVWPVIVLLSVLLLPFGWEVALANILLDVTAETTPPGSWMVHMMEPPTSEQLGKDVLPLMHSVVYENPRVFEFVCDWIACEERGM